MPENSTGEPHLNQDSCPISLDFDPHNSSNFPKSAIPTWIATSTISGVTALPTFYINLLVIWTVLEKESLRSANFNLLLAVLSLTDLLVGLVVQPLFTSVNVCIILECPYVCNLTVIYALPLFICVGWSVSTLAIISLDRYLFIEHPLYYHANVTTKKLTAVTAAVWVLVAMILVVGRLQSNDSYKLRQVPFAVVFGLGVVIVVFCLSKVNLTAYRQMKAINAQKAAVQQTDQNRIKEYKRTFTLGLLAIASVLLYCPSLVVKIIGVSKGKEWNDDFKYTSQQIWLTLVHIQSLINPLILSLRLSYIRAGVIKKLCWCYK